MPHRTSPCASCPVLSRCSPTSNTGQLRLFVSAVVYDTSPAPHLRRLREAIAPYLCLETLRRLATSGEDIHTALRSDEPLPDEVQAIITILASLLTPLHSEAIRSPGDLAARLLVEIGHLDHEVFVVACLDNALRIQRIVSLYRGTANSAPIRVAEVFRPAIALGSTSIIVAHNHPAGSTTPSPEDIEVTTLMRQAGQTLDIELVDHLIIAQGRWISMRSERQGW